MAIVVVAVEHDRQTEQQATAGAIARHHGVVILLVHEAPQGREAAHHQQFHVAGVAVAALHTAIRAGLHRLAIRRRHHQVHQGAAMGGDQPGMWLVSRLVSTAAIGGSDGNGLDSPRPTIDPPQHHASKKGAPKGPKGKRGKAGSPAGQA
jgi:hypothetical protein